MNFFLALSCSIILSVGAENLIREPITSDNDFSCQLIYIYQKLCTEFHYDDICRPFNANFDICKIKRQSLNLSHCPTYRCVKKPKEPNLHLESSPTKQSRQTDLPIEVSQVPVFIVVDCIQIKLETPSGS